MATHTRTCHSSRHLQVGVWLTLSRGKSSTECFEKVSARTQEVSAFAWNYVVMGLELCARKMHGHTHQNLPLIETFAGWGVAYPVSWKVVQCSELGFQQVAQLQAGTTAQNCRHLEGYQHLRNCHNPKPQLLHKSLLRLVRAQCFCGKGHLVLCPFHLCSHVLHFLATNDIFSSLTHHFTRLFYFKVLPFSIIQL